MAIAASQPPPLPRRRNDGGNPRILAVNNRSKIPSFRQFLLTRQFDLNEIRGRRANLSRKMGRTRPISQITRFRERRVRGEGEREVRENRKRAARRRVENESQIIWDRRRPERRKTTHNSLLASPCPPLPSLRRHTFHPLLPFLICFHTGLDPCCNRVCAGHVCWQAKRFVLNRG